MSDELSDLDRWVMKVYEDDNRRLREEIGRIEAEVAELRAKNAVVMERYRAEAVAVTCPECSAKSYGFPENFTSCGRCWGKLDLSVLSSSSSAGEDSPWVRKITPEEADWLDSMTRKEAECRVAERRKFSEELKESVRNRE